MNTTVNQHILQAVDWSRFDLEGWLYQFGAWIYSHTGTCSKSINPIAIAMDTATKEKRFKKLGKNKQAQIIADYIAGNYEPPKSKPNKVKCEISDNEARAVQRLVMDMQGQSEVMDDWMDAIISRYFYNNSWAQMVLDDRTQMDARMDVKCGLAALHCRYGFIAFGLQAEEDTLFL